MEKVAAQEPGPQEQETKVSQEPGLKEEEKEMMATKEPGLQVIGNKESALIRI